MAVTKIRKVSSLTLLIAVIISIAVVLMFFFGGFHKEGELRVYENTGLLLSWAYVLFGLTIVVTLIFALGGLLRSFQTNAKKALMSVGSAILLLVLLLITYAIGDGTVLQNLSADFQEYNVPGWLKTADMYLYTIYVMAVLIVVGIVWGSVRKAIKR